MSLQRKIGPIILFLARLGDAICSTFERGALHSFFFAAQNWGPNFQIKAILRDIQQLRRGKNQIYV